MKRKTDEEIINLASKYKTLKEFRENEYNAYCLAIKRGILKEIHKKVIVLERKNVTDEEVIASAKKYKTRKEFRENNFKDYSIIMNRGLQDVAFSHMERIGNRYMRCIYVYEFNEYKTCYVGLTYNLRDRDCQHRNKKHVVLLEISLKNIILIYHYQFN